MNNSQLETLNSTERWRRSVEQALWGVLTAATLYLVVVLVMFEVKCGENLVKQVVTKRRKQWTSSFGKNPMCILAAVFSLLRCASLQFELSFGTQSDAVCQTFMFLYYTLNNLNLLAVYCMLWTRQRNLYKDAVLRYLLTPCYRFLNVAVLVGLIVAMVVLTSLVFVVLKLVTSPLGCMYITAHGSVRVGFMGACYCGLVAIQSALLGLMLYPLFRHYGIAKSCCCSKGVIKERSNKIQNVVTRLCVSTSVCVISDVILGFGSALYDSYAEQHRPTLSWLLYNLNMIVNTVALVCTFRDWTERLFPWKHQASSGAMATKFTKAVKAPSPKNKPAGHKLKDRVPNAIFDLDWSLDYIEFIKIKARKDDSV